MGGTNNTLDKAEQKLYNQSCLLLRGFRLQLLEKFPTANVEMVTSHGIIFSYHLGQPAEDIVEYAEKQRVGTVILGSRSMSKIKKVLLGSVGDYCTHHLKCPVMIIKAPKKM
jgi:flavorubredoxin